MITPLFKCYIYMIYLFSFRDDVSGSHLPNQTRMSLRRRMKKRRERNQMNLNQKGDQSY
jgi:hypothetical protein